MVQPDPPRLAFDDVVIDRVGRRLLRAGIEQPLEPKAFAVIALLAGAPGRAFTRDEILDAVWAHRHVTPGVLNRLMTLLRHALGEDAQHPRYLHTVYGVGYRLDLPEATIESPNSLVASAGSDVAQMSPSPAPTRRASDQAAPRRREWPWVLSACALALLAGVGWGLWPRPIATGAGRTALQAPLASRSIAVLPLANASGDPDQQYFSDGLSENLIDTLSRFDGLRVIGRTSSFRFRGSNEDSIAIGRKLGVAYLVSGSVQRAGDGVRIRVELVATGDGQAVWTEHYDRPYRDLFALQDEIGRAIAMALQAKLRLPARKVAQDDRPPGGDIEAYNAYLRGMQAFYRQDMREAARYHALATRLDPAYAAAWAQLSVAWALVGYGETGPTAQAAFRHARDAVDTAMKLAPELGIAHGALGNLLLGSDFDWQGAIAELRRGTELAPENGQNHGGLSRALAASGHLREALVERERFIAIEPLQAFNYSLHADLLLAAGRLDEAEDDLRLAQQLASPPQPAYRTVYVALLRGDAKTAHDLAARHPEPAWREMNLALAAQIGSDRALADATLANILARRTWLATSPYIVAQVYALRGENGHAVEWLERAWRARDTSLHRLLYDPILLRMRNDPGFQAFCHEIGLPAPATSEALDIDRIRARQARPR